MKRAEPGLALVLGLGFGRWPDLQAQENRSVVLVLAQALECLAQAPDHWVWVSENLARAQAQGQAKADLVLVPALEHQRRGPDLQFDVEGC